METTILSTQLPVLEEVEITANTQFLASSVTTPTAFQVELQDLRMHALLMEIFTYQMEEQALFCPENYSNN